MVELLKKMRYPGRFLAIGVDGDAYVVIYGATGRSPASLARRFVHKDSGIYMGGIDDTVTREGNPELLEYPAIQFFDNGVVVANGRQIEHITRLENREAKKQLSFAMHDEAYEPDEYRTPRITGLLVKTNAGMDAAIHIVRSASDGIDNVSWAIPLQEGQGRFISTYVGEDVKPTPSFEGEPLHVTFDFGSAKVAVKKVFDALKPRNGQMDYRVGVVAIYVRSGAEPEIAILNKNK